ncbi:MarR family winged helix-turn-helix transcriptional regulator [Amycolatopsis magusensis]|uniref:MarR family winged helix-turn-helix transcriptional regulator n=1 Tax=Amycolatopsis magusensis TaxID=882444 RepID=UPI003C2ABE23
MAARNSTTARIGELLRDYGLLGLRMGEAFAERLGMEHVDLRALTLIGQADRAGTPQTVSGLRHQLGLSAGGTTLVLDRLERAGHVQRVRDARDRRAVRLVLTADGRDAGRQYFGGLSERLRDVATDFSEDDLTTVRRFLEAVIELTGEHLTTPSQPQPAARPHRD